MRKMTASDLSVFNLHDIFVDIFISGMIGLLVRHCHINVYVILALQAMSYKDVTEGCVGSGFRPDDL